MERMAIAGQPHGEVMVYQPMVVTDISRGGAQVETTFPLQIDSLHDFRFVLGGRSVIVKGRVVHARLAILEDQATVYRTGIEFVEPSERVMAVIGDFMEKAAAAKMRE
jgi:hypothetical protein